MDDLKAPQRIATAIVAGTVLLTLALILLGGKPADGQVSDSPVQDCVGYLTVARDLHRLRLWYMDGQPGGDGFDGVLLAWVNVQADATVMRLAYGEPVDWRGWDQEWVHRYETCLSELRG